jgi:hypothetical protein
MNATGTKTGADRERRRHHREADLVGAGLRRLAVAAAEVDVADDVLAHHDGVVDQQADAQAERHHRHEVDREAEQVDCDERRNDRDRQRQAGDDRAAPAVQEEKTIAIVSSAPSISVALTPESDRATQSLSA